MHWSCQAGPGHFGTGRPVRAVTAPEEVSVPLDALEVTLEIQLLKEKLVVITVQTFTASGMEEKYMHTWGVFIYIYIHIYSKSQLSRYASG